MEEWRDVPGFEGLYQISIATTEGRCRSLNYRRSGKIKELSNKSNKKFKRIYWGLNKDGIVLKPQAAVWIALTFPELVQNKWFEGAEIDHIDTDSLNNHPSNLRWVTRKENLNNPLTRKHNSESHRGKKVSRHGKKVLQFSKNGELIAEYISAQEAARQTGFTRGNITDCCRGLQKTVHGYIWKYKKETEE